MKQTLLFDDLCDVYEAMIDWPKRLAHETPFYRREFERHGVRSVVDTACGVGRHAALFHSWNLRVEGADLSPGMIRRARECFGEPPGLRWAVRGFDQAIETEELFDAAVCVGNSLALAPDLAAAGRAISAMLAALRDGGVLIVHVLNLWRLPDGPCVWQKCCRKRFAQGDVQIIKGVHRSGPRGFVDLIVVKTDDAETPMQTDCAPLLGLEAAELASMAQAAGAADVRILGGYEEQPYDRGQSGDLLMVATKGRG